MCQESVMKRQFRIYFRGEKAPCLNLWSVRCVWTRLAGWNSSGFYINALHLGEENEKVSA